VYGFGGNCDCGYGISYAGEVVIVGLVILASSPFSSELLVPTYRGFTEIHPNSIFVAINHETPLFQNDYPISSVFLIVTNARY
jgi:hypothetical protein